MSDYEIATILRDFLGHRLNTMEMLVCHYVAENRILHPNDKQEFNSLKAMFAADIEYFEKALDPKKP
jgi:hypothetical protein